MTFVDVYSESFAPVFQTVKDLLNLDVIPEKPQFNMASGRKSFKFCFHMPSLGIL